MTSKPRSRVAHIHKSTTFQRITEVANRIWKERSSTLLFASLNNIIEISKDQQCLINHSSCIAQQLPKFLTCSIIRTSIYRGQKPRSQPIGHFNMESLLMPIEKVKLTLSCFHQTQISPEKPWASFRTFVKSGNLVQTLSALCSDGMIIQQFFPNMLRNMISHLQKEKENC